ncbi:MAG: PilZ domain-containing protein [Nitrospira sp.]
MIGRRRIDKRVSAHPPVQATARRVARRIPVQIMARFSAVDSFKQVGDGVALDLSDRGCKLRSTQVLPIGHFRALYLTIPETSRLVLISEFRVIWAAENEYGIEFLHITAREQARLRHFIWKQMNRSILKGNPPSLTLQDHSHPRQPQLKSLP